MIDVSVIIPVYNVALLLNRCLNSVFSQGTGYSMEVILVDDGSTDNSVDLIKLRKEKNIKLIQQRNSGPAVARNKGVENAIGRYCVYLDADDYWLDGYIQKSVSFLDEHPECVAVTVAQKYLKNGVEIKKHTDFMCEGVELTSFQYADKIKERQSFIIDDFFSFWAKWEHVGTCSTTVRRDVLLQCGGQRSDLRICEDLEFWPYLATYGKWGFIPEVMYVSDGGAIVRQQGWAKYVLRFKNVPMYDTWFKRLKTRLTEEQIETLKPVLNGVVCGHSRAMISGGDIMRAYTNLGFLYGKSYNPIMVKMYRLGKIPFCFFAVIWRIYQYLKINRGVMLGS